MTEETGVHSTREYAMRAMRIFLMSMAITTAFTVVALSLPVDIRPHLAISLVLGLLFGPFACLGANVVSLVTNIYNGVPSEFCLLDIVTVFVVAYFPYHMWYSTPLGCDPSTPPALNAVRDVKKFVAVMIAASVIYTVLYNLTYGMLYGTFELSYDDLSILLSVLSFSIIFGMFLIVTFRYLGIGFYHPHESFRRHDRREAVPRWFFDIALVASAVVAPVLLTANADSDLLYPLTVVTYALVFVYLLKPMATSEADDSRQHIGTYSFDGSLIERVIVILVVIGLGFSLASGFAAYYGILEDLFGQGKELSTVFYMGATSVAFFLTAILFLKYVEDRISTPLGRISEVARNFVDGSRQTMSSEETVKEYGRYADHDSEIGVLARSLTEMTRDIEAYVEDIRNLNSREEMYRAEMSVAASIQSSLVPKDFDGIPGVNVAGKMLPARYVGGDLYDFFRIDDGHLAVVVADVSGKGVSAALFMAVTKALMEECAKPGSGPEEVLGKVNDALCRNNDESMFVTSWFGILDIGTGVVEFTNAGHQAPVIVRSGGVVEVLRTRPCMALGGMEGARYRKEAVTLSPGDRLILYTDGVTEANSDYSGFYGEDRLIAMAGACSDIGVREEVERIVGDVMSFTGDSEQFDDITLFILEFVGTSSSRP